MRDLVLLVADKNMRFAIQGALSRPRALGLRQIEFDFVVLGGDGGVRKYGPEILRLKRRTYSNALLLLDYEGCGARESAAEVEERLDKSLSAFWGSCAKAIVINPEVDVWMWGSDKAIMPVIEWNYREAPRDWLRSQSFEFDIENKPLRPKEAMQAVLRKTGVPRSSSLYEEIAKTISLNRCTDRAFHQLRSTLAAWFPLVDGPAR